VAFALPILAVAAAADASAQGFGLFNRLDWPVSAELVLAVLAFDLAIWTQHLITHKVPLFWRFHRVHHADRDFDVTTALRFHPVEIVASAALKVGLVYLLGPSVLAVILFEITLNAMRRFGVTVERDGWRSFTVPAGARYVSPGELYVEGDASSASYFLAAGAISGLNGGGPVRVQGVGRDSTQGDVRFADALAQMGAAITMGEHWIEASAGDEARQRGRLRAVELDCNHIPDAAMTLAMAALFADGTTTLRNIASWRVKETDRIAAMARELAKLGAVVEEGADYLKITPPAQWLPATIDTYDDHRMAMCFSLAALGGVAVRINDPGCVAKTFPDYFPVLAGVTVR
jgi:3-phosphoshikimate 1-carboxyvinyltransferase